MPRCSLQSNDRFPAAPTVRAILALGLLIASAWANGQESSSDDGLVWQAVSLDEAMMPTPDRVGMLPAAPPVESEEATSEEPAEPEKKPAPPKKTQPASDPPKNETTTKVESVPPLPIPEEIGESDMAAEEPPGEVVTSTTTTTIPETVEAMEAASMPTMAVMSRRKLVDTTAGVGLSLAALPEVGHARLGGNAYWTLSGLPSWMCSGMESCAYDYCGNPVGQSLYDAWRTCGYVHYLNFFDLPDAPDRGVGGPLINTSWRRRPVYGGWFMGPMMGSELITNWTGQRNGFLGGYRLGWDFDHYWGTEMRFGFGANKITDSDSAVVAQRAADAINYPTLAADDPFHDRFKTRRVNEVFVWDVQLLYYPLGNARWRPYVGLGVGLMNVDFMDRLHENYSATLPSMPMSLGVKYFYCDTMTFRMDMTDNLAFGANDVKTQNNFSITFGIDFRFGGRRRVYWPYSPGVVRQY